MKINFKFEKINTFLFIIIEFMDSESYPINIQDLKCPITRQLFLSPVVLDDGFIYEEGPISDWLKKTRHLQ